MSCVLALNALQNSMMFDAALTQGAGPTGGDGVGLPRLDLQLHRANKFLGHCGLLLFQTAA